MIGNAWYWGDVLLICPELQPKFTDVKIYNAVAWPRAVIFYENSFERGLGLAFGNYMKIYESGVAGLSKDRFEHYFSIVADYGDPNICNSYALSREKSGDLKKAISYYKKAAEGDNAEALYNLGTLYYNGEGVDEDSAKAFGYFRRSAELNYARAFFMLGDYYFEGAEPVAQDYAMAVKWLRLAFENDAKNAWKAAGELAVCLQNGLGTAQDDKEAFRMLSYIDDKLEDFWSPLDSRIYTALGVAYSFGRGVERDVEQGLGYLDEAIELGSHEALAYKEELLGCGKDSNNSAE